MNRKYTAILAAAVLCTAAVSCGKDTDSSSEVVLEIASSTAETTTEAASAETTTAAKTTASKNKKTTTTAKADDSKTETTAAVTEAVTTEKATSAPDSSPDNNNSSTPDTPPTTPHQSEPETPKPTEAAKKEVKFSITDLLGNASPVIAELGNPVSTGGGDACTQGGYDVKVYTYSGVEIQCYIDGGSEYIYDIMITGGDFKTIDGLGIGSSRSQVEAVYGQGNGSGNMVIYSFDGGNKEIDFTYSGDTVTAIEFYTPV